MKSPRFELAGPQSLGLEATPLGYWELDLTQDRLSWSPELYCMFGCSPAEFRPELPALADILPQSECEPLLAAYRQSLEQGLEFRREHRLRGPDGALRYLRQQCRHQYDPEGRPLRSLGWVQDLTGQVVAQQALQAVAAGQQQYLQGAEPRQVFDRLLGVLLELTGSEYGFIGEILQRDDGAPYFRAQAFTDIAWAPEAEDFYRNYAPNGLEFDNMDTLFGAVLTSGAMVIANDPASDPRSGGLPPGHPPLNAFLGVPLRVAGELVGLVGIANRPQGYDTALVQRLEVFFNSCAGVIGALRLDQQRRELERKLLQAKEQAEQASRLKTDFLNVMSHELRTPLTVILDYLPLMKQSSRQLSPELVAQIAEDMDLSGQHLLELINDVLDIAKIEAGSIQLDRKALAAADLVCQAVEPLRKPAADKGLQLQVRTVAAEVYADALRLRQILTNLVGNAVKFTPSGEVVVQMEDRGDRVRFAVSDTGPGIPQHRQAHIFDRFTQLNSASTRSAGGSGLGLAITKNLVEIHGGCLRLESEPGRGSRFSFSLQKPLPRAATE